jgi:hypothetical protein
VRAQREHVTKQASQRVFVTLDEPRDRRVIGLLLRGEDAVGDVFLARPLDRARRPRPTRVGVKHQRHHHRRLIGRPAMPIQAIGGIERRQIHRRHRIHNKPRKVTLRQPLANVRRHQEHLLAIARQKVLGHAGMVLNPPDTTPLCATASRESGSGAVPPSSGTRS